MSSVLFDQTYCSKKQSRLYSSVSNKYNLFNVALLKISSFVLFKSLEFQLCYLFFWTPK